jgi:anti-anti-sigma factor
MTVTIGRPAPRRAADPREVSYGGGEEREARMGDAVVNRSVEPDGTVVVELRGELDLAINEGLRLLLVETASTVRPPRIIVDMLHVSFVDSTGIGALAAGYTAARTAGVDFSVRHLAPFIADQLRMTGLYDHLVGADG